MYLDGYRRAPPVVNGATQNTTVRRVILKNILEHSDTYTWIFLPEYKITKVYYYAVSMF